MELGCPHGPNYIVGDHCSRCESERQETEQKVKELLEKAMNEITEYPHHGVMVQVRKLLKGQHRKYCLCWICDLFKPNTAENCVIAQDCFENCVRHDIVTPVFECPQFRRKVV